VFRQEEDGMKDDKEIVSLNEELMSVDFGELSMEELETRLELAVAAFPLTDDECTSNCCGTNCFSCETNSCGTNC
jgi:hypothetical protein